MTTTTGNLARAKVLDAMQAKMTQRLNAVPWDSHEATQLRESIFRTQRAWHRAMRIIVPERVMMLTPAAQDTPLHGYGSAGTNHNNKGE